MESKKDTEIISDKNFSVRAVEKLNLKSNDEMTLVSEGKTSINATADTVIKGKNIHLNSGSLNKITELTPHPIHKLNETMLKENGWENQPEKLKTIVSRAPTHEPYTEHSTGVDIKVLLGAGTPVPNSNPNVDALLGSLNNTSTTTAARPSSARPRSSADVGATLSTDLSNVTKSPVVPDKKLISVITNVKGATISGASPEDRSVKAATISQLVSSSKNNVTTVTNDGKIGASGLSGNTLVEMGIIKKGFLSTDIANDGAKLTEFLSDPSVFSGKDNIASYADLMTPNIQLKLTQKRLDLSVDNLRQLGTITGEEPLSAVYGLAASSLEVGTSAIAGWVGSVGGSLVSAATSEITSTISDISNVASGVTNALDNITNINAGDVTGAITGAVGGVAGDITGTIDSVTGALDGLSNLDVAGGIDSLASGLTSGLTNQLADITGQVQGMIDFATGIGSDFMNASVSLGELPAKVSSATNTVNRTAVDSFSDSVLGVPEIPSFSKFSEDSLKNLDLSIGALPPGSSLLSKSAELAESGGGLLDGVTGALSSVTDLASGALDSALDGVTDSSTSAITNTVNNATSGTLSNVTNTVATIKKYV